MKKIIFIIIKKINFLSRWLSYYDMYKYLNHHKWIWKIFKVRILKLTFLNSLEDKKDVFLLKDIQTEYIRDIKNLDKSLISNLWNDDISKFSKKKISDLFLNTTPGILSKIMNEIFRTNYVYGLSSGSAFEYQNSFLGKRMWSLKYYDLIVSLCEYFSLVRHESFSQGDFGYYLNKTLDELIKKIETHCGINIGFPNIGSPYGISVDNNLITFENLEHLYASERIWEFISLFYTNKNRGINIIEIGGGYGGLARNMILKNSDLIESYSLVDLPLMISYQKYFLNKSFRDSNIINKFRFFSVEEFFKQDSKFDIIINQNSFAEMSIKIVDKYAKKFLNSDNGSLLISLNHEAISKYHEEMQVSVPEVIKNLKEFKKILRSLSWVRKGYVEEVYKIQC